MDQRDGQNHICNHILLFSITVMKPDRSEGLENPKINTGDVWRANMLQIRAENGHVSSRKALISEETYVNKGSRAKQSQANGAGGCSCLEDGCYLLGDSRCAFSTPPCAPPLKSARVCCDAFILLGWRHTRKKDGRRWRREE